MLSPLSPSDPPSFVFPFNYVTNFITNKPGCQSQGEIRDNTDFR
ncbi:hypothetical protein LptCag_0579 [Leptospirillum ferriphilum]|uniref:Uncharacterized protein n=1 Tax=Leptospirillum ferriphilum TaxID=178606 RepID=A0A094W8U9_9BACT|nr:hypothetical protein LptCag_0579 [Leptospirillum ferriphilum]